MVDHNRFNLRTARPDEYAALGDLTVDVYRTLPDMPGIDQMPEYYELLRDTGGRAAQPSIEIFVAVAAGGGLAGGVTFIGDAAHYGANDATAKVANAAGIRLLVVDPVYQGCGIGKALSLFCIQRARQLERRQVVLHTTRSMQAAWRLYEKLGFRRSDELDFLQAGQLEVFGFRLQLSENQD